MEDVLSVYHRPYDARFPVICVDEAAKQILSDAREAIPMKCGQAERADSEYVREGVAALFMAFEPLAGNRSVFVRERRTALDFAQVVRFLVEEKYTDAVKVVIVLDNLNTHGAHSLYEAFDPNRKSEISASATAKRIADRIEWHFTPKHGSWLNMAEIELSVLAKQCLSERMGSREHLASQVAAWQERRNKVKAKAKWQFTTEDARVKLRKLYPQILTS